MIQEYVGNVRHWISHLVSHWVTYWSPAQPSDRCSSALTSPSGWCSQPPVLCAPPACIACDRRSYQAVCPFASGLCVGSRPVRSRTKGRECGLRYWLRGGWRPLINKLCRTRQGKLSSFPYSTPKQNINLGEGLDVSIHHTHDFDLHLENDFRRGLHNLNDFRT